MKIGLFLLLAVSIGCTASNLEVIGDLNFGLAAVMFGSSLMAMEAWGAYL